MMAVAVPGLPLEALFGVFSSAALLAWLLLILGPRRPWTQRLIAIGVVGSLCGIYAVLVMVFFFSVPGGGFGTLAEVMKLFTVPEVALAGWVHYLAFDLFVGLWIAQRADAQGLSRWLQAPVLGVTFLFGPLGLLMYGAAHAVRRRREGAT